MGGKWAFVLMLVLMGCTSGDSKDTSPPVCPEEEEETTLQCPICPEPNLEVQNKCFDAIQKRESLIQDLRKQIQSLEEEASDARREAKDWQERFYNFECE